MNFKSNRLKIIVSIVLGLVIGYVLAWQETMSFGWMFHTNVFAVIAPVLIVLIYVVWSIIEKR